MGNPKSGFPGNRTSGTRYYKLIRLETLGSLWVFYAFMYGRYFGHVAARIKPEADLTGLPGSPERLRVKQAWSYRFSAFMLMPTILETIRSSWFTGILITLLPCAFGVWVMHAVWREVLRSEVPQAQAVKKHR